MNHRGSAASIIRLIYIHTFWTQHQSEFLARMKPCIALITLSSETASIGTVVSVIEIGIFIICSCLATFHPLVAKFFPITESYHSNAHASLQVPGEMETIVGQQD